MGQRFWRLALAIFLIISLAASASAASTATTALSTAGKALVGQADGLWVSYGPRGGRALALELSPAFQNDGVAFSGEWLSSMQSTESGIGIVKSTDWGKSWAISDAGTENSLYASAVHDFSFSPNFASDQTVFAATWGGLFKSQDGGASWQWLEEAYSGPPGAYSAIAVAPDYAQNGQILAGDWGGLLRSDDGGESWLRLDDVGASADIAYAGHSSATAFAADGANLYRSQNGALDWTAVLTAPVTSLAVSPAFATDQTVFGAGGPHLYSSVDGGSTWISRTVAAGVTQIHALALSPHFEADATLFAGTSEGLYWSEDGGNGWQAVDGYQGIPVRTLAISPQWPQHAMLLVGSDAGVSRLRTTQPETVADPPAISGFAPLVASPLAWSAEANLLLTATTNHGVYGSFNGGQTWQAMGLQAGSSYYGFSDVAISPAYDSDETLFAAWLSGTGIGGVVFRSQNGGADWEAVLSTDYVGDLALSPAFGTDASLFATSGERGLLRSTDGGASWAEVGDWPGGHMNGIAQYVALPPNFPDDGTLFAGGSRGFWRLPEGATTWQPAASGLTEQHMVISLAVSPDYAQDSTLLALANWPAPTPGALLYAVFRSIDGGANWQEVSVAFAAAQPFDVTFSPDFAQNQTAYLTTSDGELFRSQDGGQSWSSLGVAPGAPALYDVIVRADEAIFAGSQTGVWQYLAEPNRLNLPLFHGGSIAQ